MSTKKKPQAKTEDKPKYRLGQKVYFTDYHTNIRPRLLEGKVVKIGSLTENLPLEVNGKQRVATIFIYGINTARGVFDVRQGVTHPSFQSAAIEHGKTIFEAL